MQFQAKHYIAIAAAVIVASLTAWAAAGGSLIVAGVTIPIGAIVSIASLFVEKPQPAAETPAGTARKVSTLLMLALRAFFLVGVFLALQSAIYGCTKAEAKFVTDLLVDVAGDVCKELEKQPEPASVILACEQEQAATSGADAGPPPTKLVRVSRETWTALKGTSLARRAP
jgi:hypothetical protein